MLNSGYGIPQTRKVLVNGLTCYERKLAESRKPGGRPLHQSESQSRDSRWRKKVTGKTDWYRNKKKSQAETNASERPQFDKETEETGNTQDRSNKRQRTSDRESKETQAGRQPGQVNMARTTSVMFVEQTPGGKLASRLKQAGRRLMEMTGFNIKIVERGAQNYSKCCQTQTLGLGLTVAEKAVLRADRKETENKTALNVGFCMNHLATSATPQQETTRTKLWHWRTTGTSLVFMWEKPAVQSMRGPRNMSRTWRTWMRKATCSSTG
jgi:hypothetical protein